MLLGVFRTTPDSAGRSRQTRIDHCSWIIVLKDRLFHLWVRKGGTEMDMTKGWHCHLEVELEIITLDLGPFNFCLLKLVLWNTRWEISSNYQSKVQAISHPLLGLPLFRRVSAIKPSGMGHFWPPTHQYVMTWVIMSLVFVFLKLEATSQLPKILNQNQVLDSFQILH